MNTKQPLLFISYARTDEEFALKLAKSLRSAGANLWIDQIDIPAGGPWDRAVEQGLAEAESLLIILSPAAVESENVNDEFSFALDEKKRVIPLLYKPCNIPFRLRRLERVDFTGEFSYGLERLLGNLSIEIATNSIGMKFVLIPAGSFTMGSRLTIEGSLERFGGKKEWYYVEKPSHSVNIGGPFKLQTTPVTQGQWQRLMENNSKHFEDGDKDCPVERISWIEAKQFINKLNESENTNDYRLPSEAEWEYACRAGSLAEFFFGDDVEGLNEFGWYSKNSDGKTHPVGKKKPNDFGLYDMYGNVWEWLEDDWHDSYDGAPDDGRAWVDEPRGSDRVVRGGSWHASSCRSAMRFHYGPIYRSYYVGFRLCRSVALNP